MEHFCQRGGGGDKREKKELMFPIIADPDRELAVKFGMLDPDEIDAKVRNGGGIGREDEQEGRSEEA